MISTQALALKRAIYAKEVALNGVSHHDTILSGYNLVHSLNSIGLLDESLPFVRDQLLPVARQSLGADHDLTLSLNHNLAVSLSEHPERTCDDLRLNEDHPSGVDAIDLNTGNDLLKAETIMQDVVQRKRRVLGPTHPNTARAEHVSSLLRAKIALHNK